jgi:hypothetical protein
MVDNHSDQDKQILKEKKKKEKEIPGSGTVVFQS